MKKIVISGLIVSLALGSAWVIKNRSQVRSDYELVRSDWAISDTKSWRMRLQTTDSKLPKVWMVIEAIPPDREHGWQHVDRSAEVGDSKAIRIAGDLEYVRIGDDRYFRGDAMFNHGEARQWIKLIPRDFPPLDGFFELRLHLSNPRTIGYHFDSIETSLWSQNHGVDMRTVGLKTYAGHSCVEWNLRWKIEDRIMNDTLCIGTSDHLPYHLTASGGWAEATYEWDPNIAIESPKPVLPRPKGFSRSDPDT